MGVIKRQGIKNTLITYAGIIIGAVNIIFIQPNYLSEEELGLTRLLYEFSYIIGLVIPLGLPNIIVRYFPFFKDKEKGHNGFAAFMLLVFFIGFIVSTAVLLLCKPFISRFYEKDSHLFVEYFMFLVPFTFIVSAITITTTYCQSLFKSTIPSFLNDVGIRVGIMVGAILYFNKIISFDHYIYFYIGIYLTELLILLGYMALIDHMSLRWNKGLFKTHSPGKMLRYGLLLCIASVSSMALRKIDAIILGTSSLKLVAIYTTAVFIAAFIEVPLGALERISNSKIADNFAKNNLNEIGSIYKDSVKYLLVIGGLLFIGINACTKYVYEIAGLPPSYIQCIDVVYLVGLGAFINISTGANSAIIYYSKYYIPGTVLLVFSLFITVILNLVLIPIYGIYGAAVASVSGTFIFNTLKYTFIYFKFNYQPYTRQSVYIFILVGACSVIVFAFPEGPNPFVNMIAKGTVGTAIYTLCIWRLRLAPEVFAALRARLPGRPE